MYVCEEWLRGWQDGTRKNRRMCITFVFMERKASWFRGEAMGLVKRLDYILEAEHKGFDDELDTGGE